MKTRCRHYWSRCCRSGKRLRKSIHVHGKCQWVGSPSLSDFIPVSEDDKAQYGFEIFRRSNTEHPVASPFTCVDITEYNLTLSDARVERSF
ncbi:hypothetical protein STEG23_011783 [Scotinomys teguina]